MALGAGLKALRTSTSEHRGAPKQGVAAVQVPSFFLCPIYLEIMRDPVTLSTGMTYDRLSIEKWLRSGRNTCPATNQVLESQDLIPNHTLRRAIQSWCVVNQVERVATPRPPLERDAVKQLLGSIAQCSAMSTTGSSALKKLWSTAKECESNRKCIKEAGAVPVLADSMMRCESPEAWEAAVGTIALLRLDEDDKKALEAPRALARVCSLLASGTSAAKVGAADVIRSVCGEDGRLKGAVGNHPGAIKGLVALVREDGVRSKDVRAGLKCLLSLCLSKKNRIVAIECRAVSILVELIAGGPNDVCSEKRNLEYALAVVEILANCAEGREAISNNSLAIPTIVNSLFGVSDQATEHAVAALWVVLSLASNRSVINTALRAGGFTRLLMVLPSDCSQRAKHKARDTLKLLNEVWGSYTSRPEEDSGIIFKRSCGHPRPRFSAES